VSLFFILKNDASLEDDRQRALTETNIFFSYLYYVLLQPTSEFLNVHPFSQANYVATSTGVSIDSHKRNIKNNQKHIYLLLFFFVI